MTDDPLQAELQHRAERGQPRGADAVWDAALAELGPDRPALRHRAGPWLAVAACLLVVAAGAWWLGRSTPSQLSGELGPAATSPTASLEPGPAQADEADEAGDEDSSTPPIPGSSAADENSGTETNTAETDTSVDTAPGDAEAGDAEATTTTGPQLVELSDQGAFWLPGSSSAVRTENGWDVSYVPQGDPEGTKGGRILGSVEPLALNGSGVAIELDYVMPEGRIDRAWGELILTTAPEPGPGNPIYASEMFPGHHALGCRIEHDRSVLCQLVAPDGSVQWVMSWFQQVGSEDHSAYPGQEAAPQCSADVDPATCPDRFRLELRPTSVLVTVNGFVNLDQRGIPALPQELLSGEVHVYEASMVGRFTEAEAHYKWRNLTVTDLG